MPPALALGIDWSPLLPPKRLQFLQHLPLGTLMKCDAVYTTPFWRAKGLSGSGVLDSGAVRVCFDNSPARRPPAARRFANLMDACIGPAPKRRPVGRATWTVLSGPASALPPKS